ncbi:MAG: 16S rRNA (guanine(966)-N(2))-methyltransferase RsmD [Proteobacteria bacterium]|nr:16S rRNA (guanine(966)-N(2))-methyltransferase RsmD [Pseudomonadota bacterium]
MRIVGGKFRGKKLLTFSHEGTRPTSDRTRETIFNILLHNPAFGPKILIDKEILDIFAGTGALGLEALSRGARSVTFVENEREALSLLYENVKSLHLLPSCVQAQDARHISLPLGSAFDLIFLDPPYGKGFILPCLTRIAENGWLADGAVVVIEMGKEETLILPPFLELVVERVSGAAKVLFCIYNIRLL